jgi:monovalent cation/hydrogen antiporter
VVERTRREYEEHLHVIHQGVDEDDEPVTRHEEQYTALRLALLARKRATVVALRDEQRIDDIVLRQFQARLDIEEVRLSRPDPVE